MLVRREVGRRLAEYYAQSADAVVGSTGVASIGLSSLWGEWHWKHVDQKLYDSQKGQWLTPVELFKPYYSNVLANFVSGTLSSIELSESQSVDLVELGGGRGTNAHLILNHLQFTRPDLYERLSYTIIDSSPSLSELQKNTLGSSAHAERIFYQHTDLLEVAEGSASLLSPSDNPTVVIALELLDNLPHDKIRVHNGKIDQAEVHPVVGSENEVNQTEEVFVPLSDDLLKSVLLAAPSYKRVPISWIPTVACGVLRHLPRERPNARLLLADFDWLPPPDRLQVEDNNWHRRSVWASGEPIVTSMDDVDHECYLQAPPCCDILFPTNFAKLAAFVQNSWTNPRMEVKVEKQADFLQTFGPTEVDRTRSWLTSYSPLLHDFGNCSVLTIAPT
jgi:hypothetical protein